MDFLVCSAEIQDDQAFEYGGFFEDRQRTLQSLEPELSKEYCLAMEKLLENEMHIHFGVEIYSQCMLE